MTTRHILLFLGIAALLVIAAIWGVPVARDLITQGQRLNRTAIDENKNAVDVETGEDDPAALAAAASAVLGREVTVNALALARMLRSEEGSAAPEVKAALAWVCLNAADEKRVSVVQRLTASKVAARDGKFGRQISRWASTAGDPYENDLAIAEDTMEKFMVYPERDPTNGAVKFVDKRAFGVQEGTRTYAEVEAEWATEGLRPFSLPGAPASLVFFRRVG